MAQSANAKKKQGAAFPWLWPVLLVIVGIVLLLDNFLLLGDFNSVALLPLLLVVAGTQILLRGDFAPSMEARTFGITRGSVESGTLEISSGGIDVDVRALEREGRLIAGQYAAGARPHLNVKDTYTHIRMSRANTPWFTLADWQIGLAKDLPWQFLISSHLGEIELDMSELIVHEAIVASGIGDIRVVLPYEAFKTLYVRSTFGNVQIVTPPGYRARIRVEGSRMFRAKFDEQRYTKTAEKLYDALDATDDAPQIEVVVSGTFGDVYLL